MSDLRDKRVELILQQMEDLPTLPSVALRVLEVTGADGSSAADVVAVIQSDPALTARILQLVHRAELGVRGEVTSVERAIVLLGFEAVRSAVLAVSVFQTFAADPSEPEQAPFTRDEFWKHCVAVACCAELLAQSLQQVYGRQAGVEPSEAFVCGLLHDLGKVALDSMLPKSFGRVVEASDLLRGNIADLERQVIGIDHMVVGKRLAEKWNLPASIRDCIWLHGQLPQALPATVRNPRLVNLVTLADLLVREQHLGYSGNYSFTMTRQLLADAIGLTAEHVEQAIVGLVDRIEPRAKTLGLGQASSSELYQQALSQANKELGRVSGQLAAKNRKLAIRARFFDALSHFHAELRPDAPPSAVMQAIGQTAAGVLDVTSCAVFSLPPGRDYAEAMLFDQYGNVFETSIVDCPVDGSRAAKPTPGDGPVLVAGPELEWLLSAISPRLAHEHRYWICLEADGVCVGGVVWGAPSGEGQRLSLQVQEITGLSSGWSLALRTTQIREEARALAEQLAEANRQLQNAQSELLRTRTVLTVGEMAAGAAHEMNNPLAVISGRSQLLASQLSDPKQKAAAHLVYEQAQRLSDIITELMDFAKPQPARPVETDLAELTDRALHEAKARGKSGAESKEAKATPIPADTTIEVTFADVPDVTVDPQQVTAALVEIIGNAIQSTEGNGPDKPSHVEIHAAFDAFSQRVVMTIADNGCGMDEAALKRAFDPFFSSKPAGRRRGMGLAKALRWVESSGGSIRLESRVGHGTRAVLLLPAAAPKAQVAQRQARRAQ